MASEEHLSILGKGVEEWNRWREENQEVRPDLREANLDGENLRGAKAHRREAHRREAHLGKESPACRRGGSRGQELDSRRQELQLPRMGIFEDLK